MKALYIIFVLTFILSTGYCQEKTDKKIIQSDSAHFDTAQYKVLKKVDIKKHTYQLSSKPLYRPTRLGSSSPLYNTYKKNAYGAGAITTNPNKSGRSFIYSTSSKNDEPLKRVGTSNPVVRDTIFVVRDSSIKVSDSIRTKKH